ncbi:MAG: c-type cytochrome biogenesis protein CcsB [Kiritimatiellia bacterium]
MLALVAAIIGLVGKGRLFDKVATCLIGAGVVVQTSYILARWVEAGRPPFSNMFESLVLFAWSVAAIYLMLRIWIDLPLIAPPAALMSAMVLAYASTYGFEIQPLVPALQSNWLSFHVFTCFLGYGGFAIAFVVGIGYLVAIKDAVFRWFFWAIAVLIAISKPIFLCITYVLFGLNKADGGTLAAGIGASFNSVILGPGVVAKLFYGTIAAAIMIEICYWIVRRKSMQRKTGETLDLVMTRTVSFGFIFLTLGIITGAVWANSAWGSYWTWDPKEVWSLITWLIYAVFLHCKFMRGWRGRRAAWISIIGFVSVLTTYVGVNLLMDGLHSYGSK